MKVKEKGNLASKNTQKRRTQANQSSKVEQTINGSFTANTLNAECAHNAKDQGISLNDVGARLRAFRMGRGLTSEELADRLGLSRAALYRAEYGKIAKIETLSRISKVLNVSLASLLGVGVEYIDNSVAFFERMRQIEEVSDKIIGLFGPVSYLLTSDSYDKMLSDAFLHTLTTDPNEQALVESQHTALFDILQQRKLNYQRRRPLIVSLITSADLERFLLHGMLTQNNLDKDIVTKHRQQALKEVLHIEAMLRQQPIGVQIGLIQTPIPSTTFQLFEQKTKSALAISPFRLGEQLNINMGVGLITRATEPVALHEEMAERLWKDALKGEQAANAICAILAKHT